MRWQNIWETAKEAFSEFSEDEVMNWAAGLAFYSALGLAPIILFFLITSTLLGSGTQQALLGQIESTIGDEGAEAIKMVVKSAEEKPASGTLSAIVGFLTVLFSASGVLAQLQSTLNRIWEVKLRPNAGWWRWIRVRLLSMGMLFAVLFLLLVSLVVSAGVSLVFSGEGPVWSAVTLAVSTLVYLLLFAMIFKFLPDVEIAWRDVWVGAALTAVLFTTGKFAIGLYLGQSAVASSYGAAGSLVALLVWVYYSAVILFFGAEVTQVVARRFGSGIQPAAHAMRVESQPRPKDVRAPAATAANPTSAAG